MGAALAVGEPPAAYPVVDAAPLPATVRSRPGPASGPGDVVAVRARIHPGPRLSYFVEGSLATLLGADWRVDPSSDRIGIRLTGPELAWRRTGELPSEGMARGAIQVPPAGLPMILGPDHPVTGGYPVIAVVTDADQDRLAQVRPGEPVRFGLA